MNAARGLLVALLGTAAGAAAFCGVGFGIFAAPIYSRRLDLDPLPADRDPGRRP